jgi:hypothetical protein
MSPGVPPLYGTVGPRQEADGALPPFTHARGVLRARVAARATAGSATYPPPRPRSSTRH